MKAKITKLSAFCLILCIALTMGAPLSYALADTVSSTDELSSYGVSLFSNRSGIPTGEANAVLQSSDGYIWVGGYGGLLRYDGNVFSQFSGENTGLTSYSIRSLWESADGQLWVGTNEQGAFYYSGGRFVRTGGPTDTACLSIRSFAEDSHGRVWIGAADGLFYIEDGRPAAFDMSLFGKENSTVYTLSWENGLLWGVDYDGAAFAVDTASLQLKYYFAPGDLWDASLYAYSAYSDGGILYVGTSADAVVRIDLASMEAETISTGGLSAVNSICGTESDAVWFCGDSGIGVYDGGVYTDLSYLDNTEHLLCVREDYEHNIWAASSKYGVLHIIKNKVRNLSAISGMDNTETYAVCRSGGNYYIGSEQGLVILDENWLPVENELTAELAGKQVHHIADDGQGRLYIGTYYNGMYIFDCSDGSISNVETSGNRVRMILPLDDGTVAAATNAGVDIYDGETLVKNYSSFAPTPMILCMVQTADGTLLCGSDGGGVYAVKDGRVTTFANTENGLSGGVVLRIACDDTNPGYVWISCGNDVFYGNGSEFKKTSSLTEGSGSVLDIFPDGEDIWLFRSSGLMRLSKEALLSGGAAAPEAFFGDSEGLPGTVVANSWSCYDGSEMIACTNNGIGILDVTDVYCNTVAPKAAVTGVSFSDGSTWDGGQTVNIDKSLTKLSISVAALTYMKSSATIMYKMDGIDAGYIERKIDEQHEIEYTNLDAGTYRFHLKAVNADGAESEEYVLTFVKAPRFTETAWFIVLIVLITIFLTAGVVIIVAVIRIHQLHKQQQFYQSITEQSIETIAGAIDAKDPYTNGHSQRVSDFAVKIAKRMKLPQEDCERLSYIALLHDIGKIGIPDNILKKNGKLTPEEFEIIKQHPAIGGEILHNFTTLEGMADGAEYHHERYDGKGYCKGLKGADIPLFARIIGVADAYDAMNSDRCYRKALSREKILSELETGKGKQFDPDIAQTAIDILRAEDQPERKDVSA